MRSPQPYLTIASILSGFSISVFMFRLQRELGVRERHPDWPNWLAWADYLVIATVVLSVLFVGVPLAHSLSNRVRVLHCRRDLRSDLTVIAGVSICHS